MWAKIKNAIYHKKNKKGKTIYKIFGIPFCMADLSDMLSFIKIQRSLVVNPNQAIVMIDGGICSQIHQWRIGEALMKKGVSVEYDVSWFEECGKDINGVFVRNFDLLKAFPNLTFSKANNQKIRYFKKHFSYSETKGEIYLKAKCPRYFGGYYPSYYGHLLPFKFTIPFSVLDDKNLLTAKQIKKDPHPIGIHVRRGDMAVSRHNWTVCPVQYFVNAVNYFLKKYPDATFYFFSDEPNWIKKNIFPNLDKIKKQIYLIDHNGSDKGYMDLALLSYCHHFVASQGSMAHYANMLNHNTDKILIIPQKPGSSEITLLHNLKEVNPRPFV